MTEQRIKDVESLLAFTNPLRLRLYYALASERVATAKVLSQIVGQPSSLVSDDLHKLAEFGFIEEAPGHSTHARERWWRTSSRGLNWHPSDFEKDPGARGVSGAVRQALASMEPRTAILKEEGTWSVEWRGTAFSREALLRLTRARWRSSRRPYKRW
ncbi:hypothetical protein ACXC9Q_28645 [Kribbella sp. CWNU-51]